ncbi:hypothetical protein [Aeromonas veronii]|uniref:hypothetical protein n=1 Tax=Aeromonas veronii TaxID=654 RepID=UPI002444ACC6|nr:hypothetical protein [Aeromonas veronii]
MKRLVPLFTLAVTAPSIMASNTNDIWSYQDSDGTTLAQACNNKSTCELLYKNSHYIALVNNRSQTGCAIGDLLVAEHASRSFKKLDTGTCSTSASIEVNTYNRLNNIDVMVGDRLIKRYPLDAWMWGEIRKAGKGASWSKAEENAKKPQMLDAPKGPPCTVGGRRGALWPSLYPDTGPGLLTIRTGNQMRLSDGGGQPGPCTLNSDTPAPTMPQAVLRRSKSMVNVCPVKPKARPNGLNSSTRSSPPQP